MNFRVRVALVGAPAPRGAAWAPWWSVSPPSGVKSHCIDGDYASGRWIETFDVPSRGFARKGSWLAHWLEDLPELVSWEMLESYEMISWSQECAARIALVSARRNAVVKAVWMLIKAAEKANKPRAARTIREQISTFQRCSDDRAFAVLCALAVVKPGMYASLLPPRADPAIVVCAACSYRIPSDDEVLVKIAARLILGESPSRVSGGLTRAEAHIWLTEAGSLSASEWLMARSLPGRRYGEYANLCRSARSVPVARWIIACWSDPPRREALEKKRVHRAAHGEMIEGALVDRVDELAPADLRPSVDETFRRAAARLWRETERAMLKDTKPLAPAPAWWQPIRCARLLLTAAQLRAEGRLMRHCVGAYSGYVTRGESVIVSIVVRQHRSTVELDRAGGVRQHKGACNEAPPELCKRALAVCLHHWGLK